MQPRSTVLIVEDDDDIRDTLADVLEEQGYATAVAPHGQAALDYLRAAVELPCLILLDLMMPVMDGHAFRKAQLANDRLARVPVLLLSARGDVEAQAKALAPAAWLPKPIERTRLLEIVSENCWVRREGEASPMVLLVDDYEDTRDITADYLRDCEFRVAVAGNGADAIGQAKRLLPDVIVMDLALPVIDGSEAIRRLRDDDATKAIPIVVVSGDSRVRNRPQIDALGCQAFLQKPCAPPDLIDAIQRVLHARTR